MSRRRGFLPSLLCQFHQHRESCPWLTPARLGVAVCERGDGVTSLPGGKIPSSCKELLCPGVWICILLELVMCRVSSKRWRLLAQHPDGCSWHPWDGNPGG